MVKDFIPSVRMFLLAFLFLMAVFHLRPIIPPKKDYCPNGAVWKITADEIFAGKYIRCEDFNEFYDLVVRYKDKEAQKLLSEYEDIESVSQGRQPSSNPMKRGAK